MAEEDAVEGSITDSTILVTVRSLSTGRKVLTPLIRESKFDERPVWTPVSFNRSVKREEMDEKRPKRSEEPCWLVVLLTVASCVILVVARTLFF